MGTTGAHSSVISKPECVKGDCVEIEVKFRIFCHCKIRRGWAKHYEPYEFGLGSLMGRRSVVREIRIWMHCHKKCAIFVTTMELLGTFI